jgi:hypothetical protein
VRLEHLLSGDLELEILNFEFEIRNPRTLVYGPLSILFIQNLLKGSYRLRASEAIGAKQAWSQQPEANSQSRDHPKGQPYGAFSVVGLVAQVVRALH